MRFMGLDVGTKTIGVAVSDPMGLTAQPVETIRRISAEADAAEVLRMASGRGVESIVVGMPVNMDGTEGTRAAATRRFMERLKEKTAVPVLAWDERLSTAAVTRVLIEGGISRAKRKEAVDKLAASYILQGYLDSLRTPPGP
ncbi:MAG: Holliday junction resolvase RuvX [Deltaproteobacteria bacterium]|nr:Holliday junction resolvase RuvX [Deltaproteobacteria bacterium]